MGGEEVDLEGRGLGCFWGGVEMGSNGGCDCKTVACDFRLGVSC